MTDAELNVQAMPNETAAQAGSKKTLDSESVPYSNCAKPIKGPCPQSDGITACRPPFLIILHVLHVILASWGLPATFRVKVITL